MSPQAYSGLRASKPGPRWILAIACVLLTAASAAKMARDARERREWEAIASQQDGARRFPAALETAKLIDENGEAGIVLIEALAAAPAADAAKSPPPGESARAVILGVVARRPGSAFARLSLGRSAALTGPPAAWERPLALATAAAPGLDLAWTELASRYLATWESLSADDRKRAEAVLQRAFESPDFLRAALPTAAETLGPELAIRMLPDDHATLRRAAQILQEGGNARAANLVAERLKGQAQSPGS